MSITCKQGALLLANASEALRRQFELPAQTTSLVEIALAMHTEETIQTANRDVANHMMQCPICRTD